MIRVHPILLEQLAFPMYLHVVGRFDLTRSILYSRAFLLAVSAQFSNILCIASNNHHCLWASCLLQGKSRYAIYTTIGIFQRRT